jgi:hypothetical protein
MQPENVVTGTVAKQYQGRRVSIALVDGTLMSDCVLVSAGTSRVQTLWMLTGGDDVFIRRADVAEIWLAAEDSGNGRTRPVHSQAGVYTVERFAYAPTLGQAQKEIP